MTRAIRFGASRGMRGFPRPTAAPPAPPPPPPAPPSSPTIPTSSVSESATFHNGPAAYEGTRVTAGTGGFRVYDGPNSSYALLHEETAPVVGDWYYPPGVTPNDPDTFVKAASTTVVLLGSGQTVEGAFHDFVHSLYAEDTEGAEETRLQAMYTGSTFYWKAKGGGGAGTGTIGDPFNGARAVQNAIEANTINDGDRVIFDFANGACTIANEGADWPTTATDTTSFASNIAGNSTGTTNPRGIVFGSSMAVGSNATGIWFDFGDGSQLAGDWSGATVSTRRSLGTFRFIGERILVTGCKVTMPNWNYLINPTTGARRCASASNAEDASWDNNGIVMHGNGNHAFNCHVTGDRTFCNMAIVNYIANDGLPGGASGNLRGSVSWCTTAGCHQGIAARPTGVGGYELEAPTGMDIHHNTITDGGWGHAPGYMELSPATHGGNCTGHGNGISVQGKWWGQCLIYANDITGLFQDAIAGTAQGVVIAGNYIHTIGRTATRSEWRYSSGIANWAVTSGLSNANEGNGVKGGLTNKDRMSGTDWLKDDGTASTIADSLTVPELRWIVVRNIIRDCNCNGITSNESNGGFVAFNEVYDCLGPCLLILGQAKAKTSSITSRLRQNWFIMNNVFWKITTGQSGHACRFEGTTDSATNHATATQLWFYNNIVRSGASQTEINCVSPTLIREARNNVFVNNRVFGTYSTANDLTSVAQRAAAALYVPSTGGDATLAGLPVGNILREAGSTIPFNKARSYGCYLDLRGNPVNTASPPVGPCLAP